MITTLHLGLSYRCNMRCKHCYVAKRHDKMETEDYVRLLNILYPKGLMVILYTFGEPLLSDKLFPIAEYAAGLGVHQILLSNGWLLDEAIIDRLSSVGIETFNISLDGPTQEMHDASRQCEGAFYRAVTAIRMLVRMGKNVGIGMTVTASNSSTIQEMRGLAEDLGVRRLSFLRERKQCRLIDNIGEDYVQTFTDALIGDTGSVKYFFHDPTLIPIAKKFAEEQTISKEACDYWIDMNTCHIPYSVSVEPNGDVHRCNLCTSLIGNLLEKDIFAGFEEKTGYEKECFICNSLFS